MRARPRDRLGHQRRADAAPPPLRRDGHPEGGDVARDRMLLARHGEVPDYPIVVHGHEVRLLVRPRRAEALAEGANGAVDRIGTDERPLAHHDAPERQERPRVGRARGPHDEPVSGLRHRCAPSTPARRRRSHRAWWRAPASPPPTAKGAPGSAPRRR